jgi:uncharacterized coiled-coil protein SlyX
MSIQSIQRRLAELEQKVMDMDAHVQALADKVATVETVASAVANMMTEMKAKLEAASVANDWSQVDALGAPLDRSIAVLQALLPAVVPAPVDPAPPVDELPPAA